MAATGTVPPVNTVCKKCKSKVNNGLKCITCDSVFHPSCAKLKTIKIIDKNTLVCCEAEDIKKSDDIDSVFFDSLGAMCDTYGKIDVSIMQYVLKQKDTIISELRDKIRLLNNHIDILTKINSDTLNRQQEFDHDKNINNKKVENKTKRSQKQSGVVRNVDGDKNRDELAPVTKKELSLAVEQAETNLKLNKYITLNSDGASISKINNREYADVVRQSNTRKVVVGSNKKESSIKTVPKWVMLHVCRLDPQTKEEDLRTTLVTMFPEVKCEILNSKYPDLYSSFKVTIYEKHFSIAMSPDIWPEGAYISRFFTRRKTQQKNT